MPVERVCQRTKRQACTRKVCLSPQWDGSNASILGFPPYLHRCWCWEPLWWPCFSSFSSSSSSIVFWNALRETAKTRRRLSATNLRLRLRLQAPSMPPTIHWYPLNLTHHTFYIIIKRALPLPLLPSLVLSHRHMYRHAPATRSQRKTKNLLI